MYVNIRRFYLFSEGAFEKKNERNDNRSKQE